MSENAILFFAAILFSALGAMIIMVLNNINGSIDSVRDEVRGVKNEVKDVNDKLEKIETDLHKRVSDIDRRHQDQMVEIDRRVSRVEARCEIVHRGEQ